MAIADKCSEATFSLTWEDEAECIEGIMRNAYSSGADNQTTEDDKM